MRGFGENDPTAMPLLRLTPQERRALQRIARKTLDARVLRRAQVLLDLDRGARPSDLAERFLVSRSTIYNWVQRYRRCGPEPEAVEDRRRPGRPPRRGSAAD